jgi:hypothetical protein
VIETVPFDIIFSFIIGMGIVLVCSNEVKNAEKPVLNRYFTGTLLFQTLFYIPIGIYLYYFHTAWSWMYFLNPSQHSPASMKLLGLIAILCYMLALIIGFQWGQFLVRRDKGRLALRILVIALVVLGIFSLLTLHRLFYIGDYSSWQNDLAVFLMKHRVGYINIVMAAAGGAALYFMISNFKRYPEEMASSKH